jgi:hypothetical protein
LSPLDGQVWPTLALLYDPHLHIFVVTTSGLHASRTLGVGGAFFGLHSFLEACFCLFVFVVFFAKERKKKNRKKN